MSETGLLPFRVVVKGEEFRVDRQPKGAAALYRKIGGGSSEAKYMREVDPLYVAGVDQFVARRGDFKN